MNEKDTEYENNNIGYDHQYTEEIMNYVKQFYPNGGLNVKEITYASIVI